MNPLMQTVLVAIITGLTNSGAFTFATFLIQRKDKKKDKKDNRLDAQGEMLMGLGHDRITYLGAKYLERGYVTVDEYENLNRYLYQPYKKLGGNGTAEKIMIQVKDLPVSDNTKGEHKNEEQSI